jgi:hypothetical protein
MIIEPLICFICEDPLTVDQIAGHEDNGPLWCERCAMNAEMEDWHELFSK